jgi:DNA-directed RNA polymerase subunit RPC12/RpoP
VQRLAKERKCMDCGTTEDLWGTVDRCKACSFKRMHENIRSMVHKKGPTYDRWLAAMKARFG